MVTAMYILNNSNPKHLDITLTHISLSDMKRQKKKLAGLDKEDIKRTLSLEGLNSVLDSEDEVNI